MKRILVATIAALAATLSTSAFAQDWWSGPEVGIQGGYGWGPPSIGNPDGGMGGGHAGYNWQMGSFVLGIEGDAEGGDITGRHVIPGTGSVGSDMDFDASVRGKLGWAFDRFLVYGTGGVAFGDVEPHYFDTAGAALFSQSSMRVGWTAGGGLGYAFTPNWDGSIEYRYIDLGTADHTFHSAAGTESFHSEFEYNIIQVGLTYRFAPPPPPPPMAAPMPVAAPAPPPPPMARTFLVFFDFDKYNLTADARRVIDAAAASFKANGSARIELSGYTDLAGTQAYNLRLSQRRADAVAGYMMKQGVPKNVMDVKWFGKEHPRVPTPDGVREPQNRRVEIVLP
jgi:outer membrane protein OmpA-like peptidoglycan-associated protein